MFDDDDDDMIYKVVLNHEEQYSIWPAHRELPLGWYGNGKEGLKQVCLDHIDQVWTDMRPLSLQKKMVEWDKKRAERDKAKKNNDSGEQRA